MTRKAKVSIEQIKEYFFKLGYTEDAYGNLKKTSSSGTQYRLKFQAISVRFEKGYKDSHDGSQKWIKIGGDYLRDVKFKDDGRLLIGSKAFRKAA